LIGSWKWSLPQLCATNEQVSAFNPMQMTHTYQCVTSSAQGYFCLRCHSDILSNLLMPVKYEAKILPPKSVDVVLKLEKRNFFIKGQGRVCRMTEAISMNGTWKSQTHSPSREPRRPVQISHPYSTADNLRLRGLCIKMNSRFAHHLQVVQ
jgi:hypothetical protein